MMSRMTFMTLAWVFVYPLFALGIAVSAYTGTQVRGIFSIGLALACVSGIVVMWRWRLGVMDGVFVAFLTWISLCTIASYASGTHTLQELYSYFLSIGWYAGAYSLGRQLDFRTERERLLLALILTVAALLPWIDWNYLYLAVENPEGGDSGSYQNAARTMSMIAILALCVIECKWHISFVVTITIAMLFVIGARGEFYSFVAGIACAVVLLNFFKPYFWIRATLVGIIMVLIGSFYGGLDFSARNFQLLTGHDESLKVRLALFAPILGPLLEDGVSVLFGDLLSYQRITGDTGLYIHNALSVLSDFGIMGFGLYVSLCFGAIVILIKHHGGYQRFGLLVLIFFSMLMIIVAKSFFWFEIALFWGLAAQVLEHTKSVKKSSCLILDKAHFE